MLDLTHEDHETVLAYFKSQQIQSGYHGPCYISLERLAELHLDKSQSIANNAIHSLKTS